MRLWRVKVMEIRAMKMTALMEVGEKWEI